MFDVALSHPAVVVVFRTCVAAGPALRSPRREPRAKH